MDIEIFRRGAFVGFAVAAPVGPIGVLVIRRSVTGARLGLATGMGAAAADALYAIAGALATALVARVLARAWPLEIVSGAVLGWIAFRTWTAPGSDGEDEGAIGSLRYVHAFGETLLLTLANPATVLSFAAVSASAGLASAPSAPGVFALSGGVLLGAAAWWALLSGGVRLASRRLTPRVLRGVRLGSSLVIAAFAIVAVAHGLRTAL